MDKIFVYNLIRARFACPLPATLNFFYWPIAPPFSVLHYVDLLEQT